LEYSINTFGLHHDVYAALNSAEQFAVQNATNVIGCSVTPIVINYTMIQLVGTWPDGAGCRFPSGVVSLATASDLGPPIPKNPQTLAAIGEALIDRINAACPDTPQQYTIKLSNDAGPSASGDLAEVEPGQTTTTLRAKVYDSNNQLVPSVDVKLEVTVDANSGGHSHDNNRPKGLLSGNGQGGIEIVGNTGSDGLPFTFTAPAPAGDHKVIATCTDSSRTCTREGPDKVWVGIRGLQMIGVGPWGLVGSNGFHPNNHYLTSSARQKISRVAELYHQKFPNNPTLRLNDGSLERGGLLDIYYPSRVVWWMPPHEQHDRGRNIDVRANEFVNPDAIPHQNYFDFEDIVADLGCFARMHSEFARNQHYHVTCN
jgi:hypothetical protein